MSPGVERGKRKRRALTCDKSRKIYTTIGAVKERKRKKKRKAGRANCSDFDGEKKCGSIGGRIVVSDLHLFFFF